MITIIIIIINIIILVTIILVIRAIVWSGWVESALVTRVDKIYTERARTACQQYAFLIIMIIVVILIIIIITIIIEIMIIIAIEKTAHPQQRDLGQNANNLHQ